VKREPSAPRPNFEAEAAQIGFRYASIDGERYWDESVRYEFSLREIEDDLEKATTDLQALCLNLVGRVARSHEKLDRLRIPRHAHQAIAESWGRRAPSLYGRFDFAYDGKGPPKLLEYNADTPTSLFETAVVQWRWLEQLIACGDLPKRADQFNSLHEKLIARWVEIANGRFVHLACMSTSVEDVGTVAYLEDCARQAGLGTLAIDMSDIGLKGSRFVDRTERDIDLMFKLYPWEWMFADAFGKATAIGRTQFVEPPWKAILSNKGMLALLWELAPGHPNLLPCYFEDDRRAASLGDQHARKPIFSREGADVTLVDGARSLRGESDGYGAEGFVRQALHLLPEFDGYYPVLGCWLVGDAPAGMGIREDSSPLTSNRSRFVPHAILG
jgi:glutathionylspermidine synthase